MFADVKLETPRDAAKVSKPAAASAMDKEVSKSLYHKRAGCGLFWALGRVSPTNYMIVRSETPSHFANPRMLWFDHATTMSILSRELCEGL